PTVVGYTQGDIDIWADVVARSIRAAGGRRGDLVHIAYGYGLFTGGLGAHYGAERLGCTVVPVSGGMTERQVQLIQDFRPRIIMVTPSYFLAIADEMERQGIDPATTSLEIGVFGAEPWTDDMRREIESRCAMHAVDIYGLSEVMGPGVAQECVEAKDGLHIWEDHFYPEVIDPVTQEVVADGDEGRAGLHVPHQAGNARDPLPHPRPDQAAARDRPADVPADGEDHRPDRRHDDRSWRQRLPHAGGGAAAAG
ncbi:MAG: AMP-binding protein, partial [Nocardioidaceae bacterium]